MLNKTGFIHKNDGPTAFAPMGANICRIIL